MIVATAGHVDHGKTTLVRALTGVDTDRLPEEKRRGMSIDLGFAYLPLAHGEPIAFVDVPGHERFVRNMTAGVPGIDLALLVVAADDGPMPQTHEHLRILDRLGAPRVLAVLGKIDRVPAPRADAAEEEIRTMLAASRFGGAEIVRASSVTGEGLDGLRTRLVALAAEAPPQRPPQRFRLHVDRAFVMDGLGLVVTGTIVSGSIAIGDEVQLLPTARRGRVRSLRASRAEAVRAIAGQRCALALHGLARGEVQRGDIVTDGAPAPRSRYLDVVLDLFGGAEKLFPRSRQVTVHLGTAHLTALCRPLPHAGRLYARLSFAQDVSAWQGDRFLVRDPGSRRLVGSGSVVDPLPPLRGAARPQRLAMLELLSGRTAEQALDGLLDHGTGIANSAWFASSFHLPESERQRIEEARALAAFAERGERHVMRKAAWQAHCDGIERAVADWHVANPDAIGPRPAQLAAPLAAAIEHLIGSGRLAREGPHLRLPGHCPGLSAQDEALWRRTAPLLEGETGRPPRVHELAAHLGLEPKAVADFLQRAARAGRVHRVARNRFFLPAALRRLVALAAALDRESAGRGFAAATYRDRSGLGRNLAIEVLEFLDGAGHTRRTGEVRRFRDTSPEAQ